MNAVAKRSEQACAVCHLCAWGPFWIILNGGYLGRMSVQQMHWDPDGLPKQSIPFSPKVGLLAHSPTGSSFSPWVHGVSVSPSHIRNAVATPLLSFMCNWSLFPYRQNMPTAPPAISHSLLGHVFIFPSKQRLILFSIQALVCHV